jgi:hypothetical protein
MATVTAVVQNVQIERGDDDARAAAIGNLKRATIYFDNGGVAVTGVSAVDTLDLDMAVAIQNKVRNGKTVTVRTAAISQALTTQTSAGVEVTHAGFLTAVSASAVSLTPKSDGYVTGSTGSNIGASLTVVRPYAIICAYTEA